MKKFSFSLALLLFCVGLGMQAQNVYTIYPVPQQQVAGQGRASFSKNVTVVVEAGIDEPTRQRALQVLKEAGLEASVSNAPSHSGSNIYLGVAGSSGVTDAKATSLGLNRSVLSTAGKYDRHIVHLFAENNVAQMVILGETLDATFFGLASLEQMLEKGTENMPLVTINDYADQQSRGLVEGYYGYPYTVEVKQDLMRFMMRMKMNTYLYGAKSDSYHSEKWEEPYPTTLTQQQIKDGLLSQDMVRELTKTSAATKVNFIWAVHPGNDFVWNNNVVSRIMAKFTNMYNLGVRQFAIFVDDVGVPTSVEDCQTNANRLTEVQNKIDEKWNKEGVALADQVRPLHFVPQVYTLSWVGETERKRFYNALKSTPSKITVYITGYGVWTVPNSNDLAVVKNELGRDAAWWWNYPCNDNADGQIYPSDMYYNFVEMPAVDGGSKLPAALNNGLGIVSNPMQQGAVSKTALFSVADYAWNNDGFDNMKSWQASFEAILDTPEKREAYKTIIPYLRWNDPAEMQTAIVQYKSNRPEKFVALMTKIKDATATMVAMKESTSPSERMLYNDIAPWLLKLQSMVEIGEGMTKAKAETEENTKWATYVQQVPAIENLETDSRFTAAALEGMGSGISVSHRQAQASHKYFYPFMNYLKENTLPKNFFGTAIKEATLLRSHTTIASSAMASRGDVYVTANAAVVPAKGFLGFTLKEAVIPSKIVAADTLLANHHIMYSPDGKNWKRMTSTVLPEGEYVKHVVYVNKSDVQQTIRLVKANFHLSLPVVQTLSGIAIPTETVGEATNNHLGKGNIIDNNPSTFFACKKNQAANDLYTVTLPKAADVKDVRIYFGTKNDDYLQGGTVEVSTDGSRWTALRVKSTDALVGGYGQAVAYAPDVMYVDFVGDVKGVTQVRLKVTQPKTDKWLRLYDIQVNANHYLHQFAPVATFADGSKAEAATDRIAYTPIQGNKGALLNYSFQGVDAVKNIVVYWNPDTWTGEAPKLEVSVEGTTWTTVGTLVEAMQVIDLTEHDKATRMRITWTGNGVPSIYEIKEIASEKEMLSAILTNVNRMAAEAERVESRKIYDLNGRLLRTNGQTEGLPTGVYVVGGKKLWVSAGN